MEPRTSHLPVAASPVGDSPQGERLLVASRPASMLAGEEIPRGAMVIATCDAFHAMTSDRSYRRAMPQELAIAELRDHAGTQFDPEVAEALIAELA